MRIRQHPWGEGNRTGSEKRRLSEYSAQRRSITDSGIPGCMARPGWKAGLTYACMNLKKLASLLEKKGRPDGTPSQDAASLVRFLRLIARNYTACLIILKSRYMHYTKAILAQLLKPLCLRSEQPESTGCFQTIRRQTQCCPDAHNNRRVRSDPGRLHQSSEDFSSFPVSGRTAEWENLQSGRHP